ncbi:MAG TPA: GNAT family N-acetyltransferase [Chryseolinea sp.]|nr:GNAT family N-acetyltransferase [Chryseolinea sp.]
MSPKLVFRLPTIDEYNRLRRSVEWPEFTHELVKRALTNTLFSVVAVGDDGVAVGMGRVIGDNAIYFHIQDVIVRSDWHGAGVGTMMMKELLAYVDKHSGKNTNIGLMCSKGREHFYLNFGFVKRPTEKFGSGMIKIVEG